MSIFVLVLIIGHCFAFLINEKVNVQLSSSSKISEKKKRNLDQFPRRQLIQRITTIIIFLLQEISLILSGVVIIISHHLYPRVFDIWRRRIFMALLDPPPPHPYESWYFFFFSSSGSMRETLSSLSKVVNRLISWRVWSIWKASLRFSARRFPSHPGSSCTHRLTSSSERSLHLT